VHNTLPHIANQIQAYALCKFSSTPPVLICGTLWQNNIFFLATRLEERCLLPLTSGFGLACFYCPTQLANIAVAHKVMTMRQNMGRVIAVFLVPLFLISYLISTQAQSFGNWNLGVLECQINPNVQQVAGKSCTSQGVTSSSFNCNNGVYTSRV
jgi:hypothetical protein